MSGKIVFNPKDYFVKMHECRYPDARLHLLRTIWRCDECEQYYELNRGDYQYWSRVDEKYVTKRIERAEKKLLKDRAKAEAQKEKLAALKV